nr:RusA family crossover junction endodeoxyribonuclease [Liquorilactobacillus satsumensis]
MKKIPTVTHQEKQVAVIKGKPHFYEPPELQSARSLITDHLGKFAPKEPFPPGKVRLLVKYCYLATGKHKNGEYKRTKPDLDNNMKLLQDCMTQLGFWKDDMYIVSLIAEKFWADLPGIYIKIEEVS